MGFIFSTLSLDDLKLFTQNMTLQMKRTLRAWHLTTTDTQLPNIRELLDTNQVISDQNELATIEWVVEYCDYMLNQAYKTSIEVIYSLWIV